jgi:hypothetical protein
MTALKQMIARALSTRPHSVPTSAAARNAGISDPVHNFCGETFDTGSTPPGADVGSWSDADKQGGAFRRYRSSFLPLSPHDSGPSEGNYTDRGAEARSGEDAACP